MFSPDLPAVDNKILVVKRVKLIKIANKIVYSKVDWLFILVVLSKIFLKDFLKLIMNS